MRKSGQGYAIAATEEDQNAQFCNRIGCKGRIKYSQMGRSLHNLKYVKTSSTGSTCTMEGETSLSSKGNKINSMSRVSPSINRSSNAVAVASGQQDAASSASRWANKSRSTNENTRTRLSSRQPAVNTSHVQTSLNLSTPTRQPALETSLFLPGSLDLYDQHRDMRLDIDNMSYEELLALEERMGTVSTALPEEALSSCLKKCVYLESPSNLQPRTGSREDANDDKCSICQEEYGVGDEMGRLVLCQHGYHFDCINRWLRMKNWCPFCKSSAAAPPRPPSS